MPDVFLSYSREDQPTAHRFAEALKREGFNVWWDQALDAGESFDKVTEQALKEAKAVVVLWSKHAVDSRWVRAEATQADRFGTLVPVTIEPCDRPIMFELTHTADLSGWSGDVAAAPWRAFIEGLRRSVGKSEATSMMTPSVAPASNAARASRPSRSSLLIAGVLAALLIGGGLLWIAQHRGGKLVEAQATTTTRTGPVTLAVLPFADLSQAKDQEYFSDGLTEEILNQLAQVKELRVTGRTSSFSFKGKNEDLRKIAETLGVANLLEGSIRKDGDNLRITAQLIDGRDGAHLWSKTYARELKQVFTIQEEIAHDVAQALSITLDVGESSRAKGGTTNVDAYDKYLHARGLNLEGGIELTQRAIQLLREAVALDPGFSRAWLELADSLNTAATVAPPSEAADLRKEMVNAVQLGSTLAPDDLTGQLYKLARLVTEHKWSEADRQFATISAGPDSGRLQQDPGSTTFYFASTGRLRDVVRNLKKTTQVEPLSLVMSINLQIFLTAAGENEAAQTEYERSQGLAGDHTRASFRALLRMLYQGVAPTSMQEQYRTQAEDQRPNVPFFETVIESLGDREAARTILRQALEGPANQDQASLMYIYQLADALDDKALALATLRRLVTEHDFSPAIWVAPHSGMRADPEFKQILREVGLADYFRASGNWGDYCKPTTGDDFECN
jgi:TolB-like protein